MKPKLYISDGLKKKKEKKTENQRKPHFGYYWRIFSPTVPFPRAGQII